VDLRQLRTLIQVAETGSLTRAADRLHTVQPTLSRQIRLLEEEFGCELFERQGHGMKLTEAGDRLVDHARVILRDVEHARADVMTLRGAVTGTVVCGIIPSLGDRALVPFVRSFAESNPLVMLRLVTGYAGFLVEWLARRQIDLAVVYDTAALSSCDVVPLAEEPLFVAAPLSAGLSPQSPIRLADLAAIPLILPSPQHGLRKLVDAEANRAGVTLKVRMEVDSLQAQLELVRTSFGSTILPPSAMAPELAARQISAAPIVAPEVVRRIVVARPIDRSQSHGVRTFATALKQHVTTMLADGSWPGARPLL
jgi:LysR family transcriptional regulator, nitrogen assimilation regulatory protein